MYVHRRTDAEQLAAQLPRVLGRGLRVAAYHGAMSATARTDVMTAWLAREVDLVACTTAFGMGIDRPGEATRVLLAIVRCTDVRVCPASVLRAADRVSADVRLVVHWCLPQTVEGLYQVSRGAARRGMTGRRAAERTCAGRALGTSQECGRAGRDQQPAHAAIFYSDHDRCSAHVRRGGGGGGGGGGGRLTACATVA